MWMWRASLLAALVGLATTQNYCTISPANTLCRFKPNTVGPTCGQVLSAGVTAADKKLIVDLHNQMRRRVAKGLEWRGSPGPQPPAANMRQLQWDDELALMAQTHANQCIFGHDPNRNVGRFMVGQNLAIQWSTVPLRRPNWVSQIQSWYNEVALMDRNYVNRFRWTPSRGVIGHYTALVWAETHLIGCGVTSYYTGFRGVGFPFKMLYTCNYGRSGNYLYRPVYRIGAPASACPRIAGRNVTYVADGLCV